MDELDKIKEILKIDNKKGKIIKTEYKLFGTLLIMTKSKFSESKDKVKK